MSSVSRASGRSEGAAADDATAVRESRRKSGRRSSRSANRTTDPLEVLLAHSRGRHLGWSVFCVTLGMLLMVKLGTVGRGVGALLLCFAAYHAFRSLKTFLKPAGTIVISDDKIVLPTGLCRGRDETFPIAEVSHAFFLRRNVPWTRTGPLLIIEVGERAFLYPRDWFASEADQRRIVRAIDVRLGNHSES